MAVQIVVAHNLCRLLDRAEGVPVHLDVSLELELELPLILAVDGDSSLVFALISHGCVLVDHAIGHVEILGFGGFTRAVRHEK